MYYYFILSNNSDVAASATECSSLSTEYNSAIETYQRHREAVIVLKQQYDTNAKAHADQSDYFRDTVLTNTFSRTNTTVGERVVTSTDRSRIVLRKGASTIFSFTSTILQ